MNDKNFEKKDFTAIKSNLISLGYSVNCFDNASEAVNYLDSQIDNMTVGFGGSMTLEEIGLYESLSTHNQVYWHHRIPAGTTNSEIRLKAHSSSIYISSANAIAESGEIINIDGNCNRIASLFYGHKKVYFVIGENKIEKDYDCALYRARNIAAPKNAKRVGAKTPCAINADRCYNCKSPERICKGLSVLWGKPLTGEFEIILIHENLGY